MISGSQKLISFSKQLFCFKIQEAFQHYVQSMNTFENSASYLGHKVNFKSKTYVLFQNAKQLFGKGNQIWALF